MKYTVDSFVQIVSIINLIQALLLIPNYKRFFASTQYNGFIFKRSFELKHEDNLVLIFWLLTSTSLLIGFFQIFSSVILSLISYYYFINLRFKSISRGMGAPGYFNFFLNKTVLFLLIIDFFIPEIISILVKFTAVELGMIFIISGLYKYKSGYRQLRGLNIGLINPQWSYFPNFWKRFPPNSFVFKILNFLSIWMEIIGGLLLIISPTQKLGAIIIILTFMFVSVTVRLGILCMQIVVAVSLMFVKISPESIFLIKLTPINILIFGFSIIFLILILITYYVNYNTLINLKKYSRVVSFIAHFMNRFYGISLWRVFTSDMTSLYIEVYVCKENGEFNRISEWTDWKCLRYRNVGESIVVTSIFTTPKYFPNNSELFLNKIKVYCSSLDTAQKVKFTLFYLNSSNVKNEMIKVMDFVFDPQEASLTKTIYKEDFNLSSPDLFSAVRSNSGSGTKGF